MFSERTQVLLTPRQRQALERIAEAQETSVGAVIRAAIDAYLAPGRPDREAALERLFSLAAPVADWDVMKKEIQAGALGGAPSA